MYAKESSNIYSAARNLGGLKLVHGGGRFGDSSIDSTISSLLYADTVLIPDPISPWIEVARKEERFREILLFRSIFLLLQLKPLIDANLPYPPIVVFPSMEKIFEERDPKTQKGIDDLVAEFAQYYIDPEIDSFDKAVDVIRQKPEKFLGIVDEKHLLVAPGGSISDTLDQSIEKYEDANKEWRSFKWNMTYDALPRNLKVFYAISERIIPQYHLRENSEELNAHPFLCIEQQAYYYKLLSEKNSARLTMQGKLNVKTKNMVDALGSQRFEWLLRVPFKNIIELRKNNENVIFRKRIETLMDKLHTSTYDNIEYIAAEISKEISDAIAEHKVELKNIQKKYNKIHGDTAATAWLALGGALIPSLAPYIGTLAPLVVAGKYIATKISEASEKKEVTKSLLGVLATARDKSDNS